MVLPVLSTGASLLAISTIAPEADNMLKQLVEAKDVHGVNIIKTINLEMVCAACKRGGDELTCKHVRILSSDFLDMHVLIHLPSSPFVCRCSGCCLDGAYMCIPTCFLITNPTTIGNQLVVMPTCRR